MTKLPVIVGIGGMNAAGRSSGFHSYKRMICDALLPEQLESTWCDLANRMGIAYDTKPNAAEIEAIKQGTLVRRIENFDVNHVRCHHKAKLTVNQHPTTITLKKSKLSAAITAYHKMLDGNHEQQLEIQQDLDILIPDTTSLKVSSAGGLPRGFDPSQLYNSHHHPRGLALTIYGASDAINSLGMEWQDILQQVKPDEIAVYAGSALAQIDENSLVGIVAEPLCGNRINSKMMAMSLAEMPADFINSYVINNIGSTGHNIGACATFLYNLRLGMNDIQQGNARVVIVGCAEAPIVPEIIEGFRVMGALATDESLCELDHSSTVDHRRACRPFSTNSGFTLAEASQYVILMDDELALQLGATIYGSVAGVFVNADANKKSIASPGVGNYVTMAKATALAKAILGPEGLQQTYVQAHGTGTPQNRTTESHLLNEIAKTFEINQWPVAAVKSYVGHSVSAAGGDQLLSALGAWQYGWIPGIKTIDHIAADVYQSNLNILQNHLYIGEGGSDMRAVIINSKGFGGNNASALILSPEETLTMLHKKYGKDALITYHKKHMTTASVSQQFDNAACNGQERIIYKFGEAVMDQQAVTLSSTEIKLSEFAQCISLATANPYEEYTN